MARLWQCGWELGSLSTGVEVTTTGGTQSLSTTTFRRGSRALRVNPTNTTGFNRYHVFAANQAIAGFQRVYLNAASLPSATTYILRFLDSSNNAAGSIRLTTAGRLQLMTANGNQIGSDSDILATNTWYMVELGTDATGSGTLEARLDGSTFASGANSSQGTWSRITVGVITTNATADLVFDDWALNDASGSAQNSWCGAGGILHLIPNGAGDSNGWSNTSNAAGSANNYQLVDEIPPNDTTDYVQTGTLNATDMYALADSGIGSSDVVNVVAVGLRLRNNTADGVTAVRAQIAKTSAGTIAQGSAIVPNSTAFATNSPTEPRNYSLVTYADPDGAAWTQATLDSAQAGLKLTVANTNRIQVTALWLSVDYAPDTGDGPEATGSSTAAATATAASVKHASVTATCSAAGSSHAVIVHAATAAATGTSWAAATTTAQASKSTPTAAGSSAAATTTGSAAKSTPASGTSSAAAPASSQGTKTTPAAGHASASASADAAAVKSATASSSAHAQAAAHGAAAKASTAAGTSTAAATAEHSQAIARSVTASCSAAGWAGSQTSKGASGVGRSATTATATGSAAKSAPAAGTATTAVAGSATATKATRVTGNSSALTAADTAASKTTRVTAHTYAAGSARHSQAITRAVTATCATFGWASGVAVKSTAAAGISTGTSSTAGTAAKSAPATASSSAATSGSAAGAKSSTVSASSTTLAWAYNRAVKSVPAASYSYAFGSAWHSQSVTRSVTAVCSAGTFTYTAASKSAATGCGCVAAAYVQGSASKSVRAASRAVLASSARAAARHAGAASTATYAAALASHSATTQPVGDITIRLGPSRRAWSTSTPRLRAWSARSSRGWAADT